MVFDTCQGEDGDGRDDDERRQAGDAHRAGQGDEQLSLQLPPPHGERLLRVLALREIVPVVILSRKPFFEDPFPKWHHFDGAKLISNSIELVVGEDNTAIAFERIWNLLQSIYLAVVS